jgi:anthranilate synthase component 1
LNDNCDAFDAFRALFPAGTVSGAPKVRAMEIINELEPDSRGPYAGALGYFSFNGCCDFSITIRSLFVNNKSAYLQAGAGIVIDSVPCREWSETQHKLDALLLALKETKVGGRKTNKHPIV